MIYISLPVHTRPAVIVSQLLNFANFFPQAKVVLHVSAEARFPLPALHAALAAAGCPNAIVNPSRVVTHWGNILQAHLANIGFIRGRGDAGTICLHASNDMMVRHGVAGYLAGRRNACNRRIVHAGTRWRFGAAALADPALSALRGRLGGIDIIGSQVEGSAYEAEVLYAIADLIGSAGTQPAPLPYPREEVWLSTLAHGLQATVDGKPYVFSELHRFDRVFWQVLRRIDPLIGNARPGARFLRRVVEYGMIKSGFHRIDRCWVDRVATNAVRLLAPYQVLDDGNNIWQVFEPQGLYGVKRVPRRIDAPLRRYIALLGDRGQSGAFEKTAARTILQGRSGSGCPADDRCASDHSSPAGI